MRNDGPGSPRERRVSVPGGLVLGMAAAALAAGVTGCGSRDDSLERGDRLAAADRLQEASAEYELALRRRGSQPAVLARLAEVRVRQGDLGGALDLYGELLERDSSFLSQAAAGLTSLAEESRRRGETDRMLRALEPVLASAGIRWIPDSLRLAAAEGYWDRGEAERALPLYLSLAVEPTAVSSSEVLLHVARSYEEVGGCPEALPFFREYLARVRSPGADRTGAEWHYGSCLYEVAGRLREAGENGEAAETLGRLIDLGAPRPLLDDAHYSRGEALLAVGRTSEAREAFETVLRMNPARSGPLVQQAERRLRELRYGGS